MVGMDRGMWLVKGWEGMKWVGKGSSGSQKLFSLIAFDSSFIELVLNSSSPQVKKDSRGEG